MPFLNAPLLFVAEWLALSCRGTVLHCILWTLLDVSLECLAGLLSRMPVLDCLLGLNVILLIHVLCPDANASH